MFPLVTRHGVLPIFQAGHEGSIPFARSTMKAQLRACGHGATSSPADTTSRGRATHVPDVTAR